MRHEQGSISIGYHVHACCASFDSARARSSTARRRLPGTCCGLCSRRPALPHHPAHLRMPAPSRGASRSRHTRARDRNRAVVSRRRVRHASHRQRGAECGVGGSVSWQRRAQPTAVRIEALILATRQRPIPPIPTSNCSSASIRHSGSTRRVFAAYDVAIRQEYDWVPNDYRRRIAVLSRSRASAG
jgi:hypothetical protein